MAITDSSYDNMTAITREKILPKIIDQISKDEPLLNKLLPASERKDGGKTIDQVVKFRNSTQAASYSGLEILNSTAEDTRTRATWNWKQYHIPIVVSNIDIAKNGGEAKVFDLVKEAMAEAEVDLKYKFANDLFGDGTGNSSKNFEGLIAAVDDSTNVDTYGNITRSTYTWWKSYYNGTGGVLTLSMLATAYDAVKSGNDTPTKMVTTETVWSSYEALLQPQARYTFTEKTGVGYPRIDGGFDALYFRKTPMVSSEHCTSGYLYLLNENYLKFLTLKHPQYPTDKSGFSLTNLQRPVGQDGQIGFILWYGNLVNVQPRRSGVIRVVS